jgi:Fe-S cluster biogenesis protein NfuA/nitrite reductase/ring-hydroxylating ferredoxin subunit
MPETTAALDDRAGRERIAAVERLLEGVDGLADPAARATATDLVAALLDLYGEGLARLVGCVAAHDDGGELAAALAGDELVAHLLLLHGLHPVPLETRVRAALADVRPYLESHGGDVELLDVTDGVAHLRLEGSCDGCPSSAATLKLAIEDAIHATAPDIERVEAHGAVAGAPPASPLIQLEVAAPLPKAATDGSGHRRAWASTDDLTDLANGAQLLRDVAGERVLFLRLDGRVYAYRPSCPACDASLADGVLDGTRLRCSGCGRHYDARRAGHCLDEPGLHLEPVPLLTAGDGRLKVALGPTA